MVNISNQQSKTIGELVKIIKELAQRIRLIEERISKIESSLNDLNSKLHDEIESINKFKQNTLNHLEKLDVDTTNNKLNLKTLEKKFSEYARKKEIRELKEYIDLIKPLNKIYVTHKELEEILKRELSSLKKEKK